MHNLIYFQAYNTQFSLLCHLCLFYTFAFPPRLFLLHISSVKIFFSPSFFALFSLSLFFSVFSFPNVAIHQLMKRQRKSRRRRKSRRGKSEKQNGWRRKSWRKRKQWREKKRKVSVHKIGSKCNKFILAQWSVVLNNYVCT